MPSFVLGTGKGLTSNDLTRAVPNLFAGVNQVRASRGGSSYQGRNDNESIFFRLRQSLGLPVDRLVDDNGILTDLDIPNWRQGLRAPRDALRNKGLESFSILPNENDIVGSKISDSAHIISSFLQKNPAKEKNTTIYSIVLKF